MLRLRRTVVLSSHAVELVRGSSVSFVLKILGMTLSYAFNIVLARFYGAEVVGVYALSVTVATIVGTIGQLGLQTSMVRFVAEFRSKAAWQAIRVLRHRGLAIVVMASTSAATLLFIFAGVLTRSVFHDPTLIPAFRWIAISVPFLAVMTFHSSALRGLKRMVEHTIFQAAFVPALNTVMLTAAALLVERRLLIPIWAYLITVVAGAVTSGILFSRRITAETTPSVVAPSIGNVLQVSLPMLTSAILLLVTNWLDILMVGHYMSAADVGVYRMAQRLAALVGIVLLALNSMNASKFSELYAMKRTDEMMALARFSARVSLMVSLGVFLVLALLPRFFLGVFGPEFEVATGPLILLSAGQLLNSFFGSNGLLLDMTGHQKLFRNALIVGATVDLVLSLLLVPRMGLMGAALAAVLTMICWNTLAAVYVRRRFGGWVGFTLPTFRLKHGI